MQGVELRLQPGISASHADVLVELDYGVISRFRSHGPYWTGTADTEDSAMQANCSTVARLVAPVVLVAASIAGPEGSATAVSTHETTDGAGGGAALPELDFP